MCGIAGFIGMENEDLLRRMTRIISHRGPDDEGVFLERNVGLGHRRLSILDLTSNGHQPMADSDERAVISYNGEVYNFQELREELIEMGFRFRSKTDTEVVLNAYLAWGADCLSRFNGMFAIAIWDCLKKTLFLARDRIGIKPLFYTTRNNVFLFGSEIKSILCWEKVPREVNARALDYYLTFRYNHLDETMFKGIFKLPQGHFMKVAQKSDGGLSVKTHKYWDVSFGKKTGTETQIRDEIADGIKTSVERRMISDVPLGAFLSSGVDSSTIVGIMKKELGNITNTFTVGFDYPGFEDELKPVGFTTDYFKTEHSEYICKPDVVSLLPKVIWHMDELSADPATIPTYLISEIASKKVKVVLSGEGGDELFGGYERTMLMMYAWRTSRVSPHLTNMVPWLIGMVPQPVLDRFFKYSSAIGSKGIERLSSFCRDIGNLGKSYLDVACTFNQNEKERLYGPKLKGRLDEEDIADTINGEFFGETVKDSEELFSRLSYFELKTRLTNDLLAKVDTMTMAHSLEGRVPYLDHEFVELAFSIPAEMKIKRFREKYILRKAVERYLPQEIIKRRKDHFFVPIHLWLQNELKEIAGRILTPENIEKTGFFNSDFITHAYSNYRDGQLFYARQIWNLLFFLIWHKLYIESDKFLSMRETPLTLEGLFMR